MKRERISEEMARFISRACYEHRFLDVRDAVAISRISRSPSEVLENIRIMEHYEMTAEEGEWLRKQRYGEKGMPRVAEEEQCGAAGPGGRHCGRFQGHKGRHVSHTGGKRLSWTQAEAEKFQVSITRSAPIVRSRSVNPMATTHPEDPENTFTITCHNCGTEMDFGPLNAGDEEEGSAEEIQLAEVAADAGHEISGEEGHGKAMVVDVRANKRARIL